MLNTTVIDTQVSLANKRPLFYNYLNEGSSFLYTWFIHIPENPFAKDNSIYTPIFIAITKHILDDLVITADVYIRIKTWRAGVLYVMSAGFSRRLSTGAWLHLVYLLPTFHAPNFAMPGSMHEYIFPQKRARRQPF